MQAMVSAEEVRACVRLVQMLGKAASREALALRRLVVGGHGDAEDAFRAIRSDVAASADGLAEVSRRCLDVEEHLLELLDAVEGYEGAFSFSSLEPGAAERLKGNAEFSAYRQVLRARLSGAPPAIQGLYRQCSGQIRVASVDEHDAYYSPVDDCVCYSWEDDRVNSLGEGNTYFHETGHQIDSILGRRMGSDLPASYQAGMSDAVAQDFADNIERICHERDCDVQDAMTILRFELYGAGNSANVVSDMFGSLTGTVVSNTWGHDKEYWQDELVDVKRATEAFAEMTADRACGADDHVAFTRRYLPRASALYESMIERWSA